VLEGALLTRGQREHQRLNDPIHQLVLKLENIPLNDLA
jgi:hypothetical protein